MGGKERTIVGGSVTATKMSSAVGAGLGGLVTATRIGSGEGTELCCIVWSESTPSLESMEGVLLGAVDGSLDGS